jgi:hypothetical protein
MTSCLSDSLGAVTARAFFAALLLVSASAGAQEPPPPPASERELPEAAPLPSTRVSEPEPEPSAIKVRLDGEYEARQTFLTSLPLTSVSGGPAELGQTSRLYHWLRLRGLGLFGTHWQLRAEADVPRGMIYGQEPDAVPDNGTEFERPQPVRLQPRILKLKLSGSVGEVSLGHTTTQLGLGLVDADGDQPRWFGTPDRPATYERLELLSGRADAKLRVGASADVLFDDGRLSLIDGDHLLRVALNAKVAPSRRSHLSVLARYEGLQQRDGRGGARTFLLDVSGGWRSPLPGRSGVLFVDYEGAYRVGDVSEPTAFGAVDADQTLAALAFATRAGVSLEGFEDFRRFARLVASVEWGMASGDADPTDDELHRFVMNPNHGVGLILFSEILRFKTSRAQALLATQNERAGNARVQGLATRGGIAGASYLNPVLLVRPSADLALKLGAVVASATTAVVDPGTLATRSVRANFDGGSPLGRSLGSELDLGAELTLPLDAPMLLRLSVEGALAFPGSAFDAADGRSLGTQSLTTAGLGLTF